jgi:hypothetical protein
MDELIRLVTEKANIDEAQAKKAVETVIGYLKERLPGGLGDQLDGVLEGDALADIADIAGKLGKLFDKN